MYPFKHIFLKQDFPMRFWWILSYSKAKSLSHLYFPYSEPQEKWFVQSGAQFLFVRWRMLFNISFSCWKMHKTPSLRLSYSSWNFPSVLFSTILPYYYGTFFLLKFLLQRLCFLCHFVFSILVTIKIPMQVLLCP